MTGKKRPAVSTVLGVVVFLLGSAVLLYPEIDSYIAQRSVDRLVSDTLGSKESDAKTGAANAGKRTKEGDPAYEYLSLYNEKVRAGQAGAVNDPWGIGADVSGLESMGLEGDLVGSVRIPRLDETLPLLLNATTDHMAEGAVVVSGTSAPLGGSGDNCVIAAHRGVWHGLRMFRDIEDMEIGDLVSIETPWDSLDYQVSEIRVIKPDEADALKPQPGRDLVTLFTCHPYGYNYQRYIVICERVRTAVEQGAPSGIARLVTQATKPSESQGLVVERWVRVGGLLVLIATASAGVVYFAAQASHALGGRRKARACPSAHERKHAAGERGTPAPQTQRERGVDGRR